MAERSGDSNGDRPGTAGTEREERRRLLPFLPGFHVLVCRCCWQPAPSARPSGGRVKVWPGQHKDRFVTSVRKAAKWIGGVSAGLIGTAYRPEIGAAGLRVGWSDALRRACPSQATPNPGALGRKHAATVVPRAAAHPQCRPAPWRGACVVDEVGSRYCMPAQWRCRARLWIDPLQHARCPR